MTIINFSWPNSCPISVKDWSFLKEKYHLTDRELLLSIYVCKGYSYKDIAESMCIKISTVKMFLSKIYLKVGVNTKILLLLTFLDNIHLRSHKR